MSPNEDQQHNLVLSVNAGSSSLKISLYSAPLQQLDSSSKSEPVTLLLTSSISSISAPPAKFSFKPASIKATTTKDESIDAIKDHASAFAHFLHYLEKEASIDKDRIKYICHRVVHGGDYSEPVIITQETYHHIEKLSDLAPLHNGAALSVIHACIDVLPSTKSIAFFDTAFHRTIPLHVASYAIDQKIAKERGLKKYGFHGLSYAFIHRAVAQYLDKAPESLNLILLHLGSGASACVIKDGRSLDTSMGLTPLNGLPGATRSGAIDPSLIFHYTNRAGRITHDPSMATNIGVTKAEDILNRKSGWKSITGTTDFGEITKHAELDNPDSSIASKNPNRLAFDLFADRILNYIGSYYLKLHGNVDALVFAGGIGEKSVELREMISQRVECLGFRKLSNERNGNVGKSGDVVEEISDPAEDEEGKKAKRILVCSTDEQLEMARECVLDHKLWPKD
ncbi:Acetokinase family-domain-containing protein [Crucibulum laeve]|uniref:Probable acetate kinase n=1 Tax=Crucibulum laeve TaxID=68775 RepID=A0A5C3M3Y8_9AGAR|nr:Acetokinase family-domain-containing protein [Crucibulum laeve]